MELIEFWGNQNPGGLKALPEGVFELRNTLHDVCTTPSSNGVRRAAPASGSDDPAGYCGEADAGGQGLPNLSYDAGPSVSLRLQGEATDLGRA